MCSLKQNNNTNVFLFIRLVSSLYTHQEQRMCTSANNVANKTRATVSQNTTGNGLNIEWGGCLFVLSIWVEVALMVCSKLRRYRRWRIFHLLVRLPSNFHQQHCWGDRLHYRCYCDRPLGQSTNPNCVLCACGIFSVSDGFWDQCDRCVDSWIDGKTGFHGCLGKLGRNDEENIHILLIVNMIYYPFWNSTSLLLQNSTWVTTPELYSTDMRTVGHATCVAFSKIGAFCVPFMVISSASNVTVGIVLCVINIAGAIAANFLPDTTG